MVKLLSRSPSVVPRSPPPPSLCPRFSFAVYSRNTYRSCRALVRRDGRGKVGLRETHPENAAGLIPVHGTDHAVNLHRENRVRTPWRISSWPRQRLGRRFLRPDATEKNKETRQRNRVSLSRRDSFIREVSYRLPALYPRAFSLVEHLSL